MKKAEASSREMKIRSDIVDIKKDLNILNTQLQLAIQQTDRKRELAIRAQITTITKNLTEQYKLLPRTGKNGFLEEPDVYFII